MKIELQKLKLIYHELFLLGLLIFLFNGNILAQTIKNDDDSTKHINVNVKRHYKIQYGSRPNMESGSESVIGISSIIFDQTNQFIHKKIKNKTANTFARIGNFGVVQFYFGIQLYAAIPHEYFGHYLRAREYGITPKISINFPGLGGDDVFRVKQSTSVLARQMIVAAGPEVTATIAYKATQQLYSNEYSPNYIGNYLLAGKIVDHYAYLQNNVKPFLDDPNQFMKDNSDYFKRNPVPNDPLAYALALTESYGYYDGFLNKDAIWLEKFDDMRVYTQNEFIKDQYKRMKSAYLQTLLDPTNLYFLYGNFLYLVKGQTFFKPFMFKIKEISFMPSVRANLGENGIENYYDVFFKIKNKAPFSVYYRTGGNMFHKTRGGGVEFRNYAISNRIRLDGQLDYWNNERLKSHNYNISTGFNISDRSNIFSFSGNIGYKSEGNLIGKQMRSGFYGFGGIGVNLNVKKYDSSN